MHYNIAYLLFILSLATEETVISIEVDSLTTKDLTALFQSPTQVVYLLGNLKVLLAASVDIDQQIVSSTQIHTNRELFDALVHLADTAQNVFVEQLKICPFLGNLSDIVHTETMTFSTLNVSDYHSYANVERMINQFAASCNETAAKLTSVSISLEVFKQMSVHSNILRMLSVPKFQYDKSAASAWIDGTANAISEMQTTIGKVQQFMRSNVEWAQHTILMLNKRNITAGNGQTIKAELNHIHSEMKRLQIVFQFYESFASHSIVTNIVEIRTPFSRSDSESVYDRLDDLEMDRILQLFHTNWQLNSCYKQLHHACATKTLRNNVVSRNDKVVAGYAYPFGCFGVRVQCEEGFFTESYENTNFFYNCSNGSWTPAKPDCQARTISTTATFGTYKRFTRHRKHKLSKQHTTTANAKKLHTTKEPAHSNQPVFQNTAKQHSDKGHTKTRNDNTIVGLVVFVVCVVILGTIVVVVIRKRATQRSLESNMLANEQLLMCPQPRVNRCS